MLAVLVVVLAVALLASSFLLWRLTRLVRELEGILADADNRVRELELRLTRAHT